MFCLKPLLAFLDVGGPEMLLVFVLILVLFGGKRMPELARGLGKSLRDFKRARDGVEDQIKRALEEDPAPAKRSKKIRKPEPATTTPDDTTIYDEAAKATGAATAATATDGASADDSAAPDDPATNEPATDANQNHSEAGGDDDHDYVDPYEDEYIGGTADSDARANGIKDEAAGETGEKTTEPTPEQPEPQAPGATGTDQPEKKKNTPDTGISSGEGI